MVGILPFLMQWLSLSSHQQEQYNTPSSHYSTPSQPYQQPYQPYTHTSESISSPHHSSYFHQNTGQHAYTAPKSHWTLINEFAQLPEDEIETFLPQVLNILLDNESPDQYGIYSQLERVILNKCANCLPFGLRIIHLLKAASSGPSDSIFRSVLSSSAKEIKEAKLREFQAHVDQATFSGGDPSERVRYLRSTYCQDYLFMLSSLARLGFELKHCPAESRNQNLRSALSQLNSLLYNRMLNRGVSIEQQQHFYPGPHAVPHMHTVSRSCPQVAAYSLHLPTQQSHEKALRILSFVEMECEVLPSKERCPYLVVAEVLEEPYLCGSRELYCDGHSPEHISMDVDERQRLCDQPTTVAQGQIAENVQLFARNEQVFAKNEQLFARNEQLFAENEDVTLSGADAFDNPFAHTSPSWDCPTHQDSAIPIRPTPLQTAIPFTNRGGQQYIPTPVNSYPTAVNSYPTPVNSYPTAVNNYSPDYHTSYSAYQQIEQKIFIKSRSWFEKKQNIRNLSVFGHLPGWTIRSFIVKSGDDLRKEVIAMQLIEFFRNIFYSERLDINIRPYRILSTGHLSGLVEYLEGTRSIDSIKKSCSTTASLKDYFEFCFGATYSPIYENAVTNFVKSLVGYSLVTYVLQVKDRHNANILIDGDGHVVHIDFGFILGDSPGFNINFENSPFKLTREYMDVMGGIDSIAFRTFEDLFIRGFFALQKHADAICTIVQMFYGPRRKNAAEALRSRLLFARNEDDVRSLIRDSLDSWRTKQYDWFQQRTNNILM